jgi:hypothetical protein
MKKLILISLIGILHTKLMAGDGSKADLVAHEWGTFTSFQGGDGVLLNWKPLETSKLPGFVYDWTKPGLDRQRLMLMKSSVFSLQRMETPVVYFYSDKEQTVDLEVKFPQGTITEWFPQAREVGPSSIPPARAVVEADSLLRRVGAPADVSIQSLLGDKPIQQSLIHWTGIDVLPAAGQAKIAGRLRTDRSGSHYFAARETDSAYLGLNSFCRTNAPIEYEKFLFYRGVGNFATPLTVRMKADGVLSLTNSGVESLRHLFVLKIENQVGHFVHLDDVSHDELRPHAEQALTLNSWEPDVPLPQLAKKLGDEMAEALVAEGLYPREAKAMVNTWKDSWFAEDGVRVLYLLPRNWTDATLPMQIKPAPKELVRVMVGRAEVLTPQTEDQLTRLVSQAQSDDPTALRELRARLDKLGRFAEPALSRALTAAKVPGQTQVRLIALLTPQQPQQPSFE